MFAKQQLVAIGACRMTACKHCILCMRPGSQFMFVRRVILGDRGSVLISSRQLASTRKLLKKMMLDRSLYVSSSEAIFLPATSVASSIKAEYWPIASYKDL